MPSLWLLRLLPACAERVRYPFRTPQDTFLRLFDPAGQERAYNDDAFFCGDRGTGSAVTYTVPCRYGPASRWTLAQGCYANYACSGHVSAAFEPGVLPLICPP